MLDRAFGIDITVGDDGIIEVKSPQKQYQNIIISKVSNGDENIESP